MPTQTLPLQVCSALLLASLQQHQAMSSHTWASMCAAQKQASTTFRSFDFYVLGWQQAVTIVYVHVDVCDWCSYCCPAWHAA